MVKYIGVIPFSESLSSVEDTFITMKSHLSLLAKKYHHWKKEKKSLFFVPAICRRGMSPKSWTLLWMTDEESLFHPAFPAVVLEPSCEPDTLPRRGCMAQVFYPMIPGWSSRKCHPQIRGSWSSPGPRHVLVGRQGYMLWPLLLSVQFPSRERSYPPTQDTHFLVACAALQGCLAAHHP